MGVSITADLSRFDKRFGSGNVTKARYMGAEEARKAMDKYVPYRFGDLRTSSFTTVDGAKIIYKIKYAHYQYVHDFSHYTTPGTGGHWDLKLKGNKNDMDQVTQAIVNSLDLKS